MPEQGKFHGKDEGTQGKVGASKAPNTNKTLTSSKTMIEFPEAAALINAVMPFLLMKSSDSAEAA